MPSLIPIILAFFFLHCGESTSSSNRLDSSSTNVSPDTLLVRTGADILVDSDFQHFEGLRIGLLTNHTAKQGDQHLIDKIVESKVDLAALFAPEHGLREMADAGEHVEDGIDPVSGVTIHSLYSGSNKKPTQESLENIDLLVFDIQDLGARFYTYISTMGLAMQSAAEKGIPFLVLDRPNLLGGERVDGFVLDLEFSSHVGMFEIPIIHGLTVGELAQLIKGEALLDGLETLDLRVLEMQNWSRSLPFEDSGLPWTPPSPNIPDFETAIIYPGTCLFEGTEASEGRGTYTPFKVVGYPGLDSEAVVGKMRSKNLKGVTFESHNFTPLSIEGMSSKPKLKDVPLNGVKIEITDAESIRPLEVGIHLLYEVYHSLEKKQKEDFLDKKWLGLLTGSNRFYEAMKDGDSPSEIMEIWSEEIDEFQEVRSKYLLY